MLFMSIINLLVYGFLVVTLCWCLLQDRRISIELEEFTLPKLALTVAFGLFFTWLIVVGLITSVRMLVLHFTALFS